MGRSGDSYNKKEREKKKRKRKEDKEKRKEQRKLEGKTQEFMYQDANGNLVATPPDPTEKVEISLEEIQISTPKKGTEPEPIYLRKGIVKYFNDEKGYGFIQDSETQERYFVHSSNLSEEVRENTKVTFKIGQGPRGPIAIEVDKVK